MSAILTLLLDMTSGAVGHALRRAAVFGALVLIFLWIGLAGFAAALWILLARATDPVIAALLVGAGGLVLAGLTVLIAQAGARRRRPPSLSFGDMESSLAQLMAKEGGGSLWTLLLAAAVAGFVVTGR